jgi:putative ABC transport system substrate-binding protein
VVGVLGSSVADRSAFVMAAFMQALKEAGFNEGRNLVVEQRWANNQLDRLPEMAADLVRARVSLIAAIGNNLPVRAAKAATSTIPIVFVMGADPVALGLVASFNRPGGSITGVTTVIVDILQKRLQLLHDLVPNARRFGYLVNPDNPAGRPQLAENTVRTWGGTIEVASARAAPDFDAAFAGFAERHVEAVVIAGDALFASEPERLSRLAAQYAVPVIYGFEATVRFGGLMSYSADIFSPSRSLCRPYPQRRETGRSAGRPADQVHARHQP